MATTKTPSTVDAWALVAQNTVREGAELDVSAAVACVLSIDCALTNTTAHTGTEILVEGTTTASGDDGWHPIARAIGPIGTAVKADFAGTEAAGQTELSITNPATAGVDHPGKYQFVYNTNTPAHSEIVLQTANSGDAGNTVTVRDGLTYAQDTDSDLLDIDDASPYKCAILMLPIPVDEGWNRVRVTYNNTYDSDGAAVCTRCLASVVTV